MKYKTRIVVIINTKGSNGGPDVEVRILSYHSNATNRGGFYNKDIVFLRLIFLATLCIIFWRYIAPFFANIDDSIMN